MFKLFKQNLKFRFLLMYQFFSSIGGAMFAMFILLSVHLIYQNPIYTGIAGFLMAAPRIISFAVGPIVDRRNKLTIIRLTTFLEFMVLSLLAFTPLLDQLGILFMFAVVFAYNIAALFENPAGTAMLPQIVHEEEILEANSLINVISMAGGIAIGIVLLVSLGGDVNFRFLYGFSAVFVALAFVSSLFLRNAAEVTTTPSTTTDKPAAPQYIQDIKEGAMFIRHNILLYTILALVIMYFVGEITYVNRPMFLEYHVGAQGYVLFSLMTLVGGVTASSLVGMLGNKFRVGRLVFALFLVAGVVRIAFALLVPVHIIGALISMMIFAALALSVEIVFSSLNQKIPPKDMVGRVDTISRTFLSTFVALGAFVGGFLGSIVPDVGHIFIYQGISYLVLGVVIMLIPSIRKLPKMNDIEKASG